VLALRLPELVVGARTATAVEVDLVDVAGGRRHLVDAAADGAHDHPLLAGAAGPLGVLLVGWRGGFHTVIQALDHPKPLKTQYSCVRSPSVEAERTGSRTRSGAPSPPADGRRFEALFPGPTKAVSMSESLDARIEAGIAILSALVFIGILLAGGTMTSDEFGPTGAYTVVGAIVAFILLMGGIGFWLSTKQE